MNLGRSQTTELSVEVPNGSFGAAQSFSKAINGLFASLLILVGSRWVACLMVTTTLVVSLSVHAESKAKLASASPSEQSATSLLNTGTVTGQQDSSAKQSKAKLRKKKTTQTARVAKSRKDFGQNHASNLRKQKKAQTLAKGRRQKVSELLPLPESKSEVPAHSMQTTQTDQTKQAQANFDIASGRIRSSSRAASTRAKANQTKDLIFSTRLVVETTRPVVEYEDETTSYGGWYNLSISAIHQPTNTSLMARVGYSQEYTYQRDDGTDGSFDNPVLVASKRFVKGKDFQSALADMVNVSLSGSLPANRDAQRQTFLGSIGPAVAIVQNKGRFSFNESLGYTRRFYEYDIRDDGTVNSPDAFRGSIGASVQINDHVSFSASLGLSYLLSYQQVGRTMESSSFAADYSVTDRVLLTLGIVTDRGILEADGQTTRVKIFDPNVATGFLDISIEI